MKLTSRMGFFKTLGALAVGSLPVMGATKVNHKQLPSDITPGGGYKPNRDIFKPAVGTTVFTATQPYQTGTMMVFVNGLFQDPTSDYTLSGQNVTLAVATELATDIVQLWYALA